MHVAGLVMRVLKRYCDEVRNLLGSLPNWAIIIGSLWAGLGILTNVVSFIARLNLH